MTEGRRGKGIRTSPDEEMIRAANDIDATVKRFVANDETVATHSESESFALHACARPLNAARNADLLQVSQHGDPDSIPDLC
jgi:hypothetical protein